MHILFAVWCIFLLKYQQNFVHYSLTVNQIIKIFTLVILWIVLWIWSWWRDRLLSLIQLIQEWVCTKMVHKNGSINRQCERTYVMRIPYILYHILSFWIGFFILFTLWLFCLVLQVAPMIALKLYQHHSPIHKSLCNGFFNHLRNICL